MRGPQERSAPAMVIRLQLSCVWGCRCGCSRGCGQPASRCNCAHPRGRKTPASRTQVRIQPKSAEDRQNPYFRRQRRSKNATGSVLSDFFKGSGTGKTLPVVATDTPGPASEGEESDTAARSKRQRKHMPAQDQSQQPSKEDPPEAYPCRHHSTAGRVTTPTLGAATTRRVRQAALP